MFFILKQQIILLFYLFSFDVPLQLLPFIIEHVLPHLSGCSLESASRQHTYAIIKHKKAEDLNTYA